VDEVGFQKEGATWMALRERVAGSVTLTLDGEEVQVVSRAYQLGRGVLVL
jgi:hypothetical protein